MTIDEYDLDEIRRDVRRILTMTNDVESAHGQALPGTLNHDGVPTYEMERLYNIQITARIMLSRLEVEPDIEFCEHLERYPLSTDQQTWTTTRSGQL